VEVVRRQELGGLRWLNYAAYRFSDMLRIIWYTGLAQLKFRVWSVRVGEGLRVTGPIRLNIHPTALCEIGKGCTIHSSYRANPVGAGQMPVLHVGRGARLMIGNNVGLSHTVIVCAEAVTIEDRVYLGGGTFISDTDSHSLIASQRLQKNDTEVKTRPVCIRQSSFVGGYAVLLKGAEIGEEAVIGAGAVVTGRVPPREIWAGNPARFIRNLRDEYHQT
jgi:acetyltransferase-like isoleucine patch superfamily enzyme